jgi:hypothetical protein
LKRFNERVIPRVLGRFDLTLQLAQDALQHKIQEQREKYGDEDLRDPRSDTELAAKVLDEFYRFHLILALQSVGMRSIMAQQFIETPTQRFYKLFRPSGAAAFEDPKTDMRQRANMMHWGENKLSNAQKTSQML